MENNLPKPEFKKNIFGQLLNRKIIFIILALVLLVEVIIGIRTLFSPVPKLPTLQPLSDGKIALIADSLSYQLGDDLLITIKIATGGHSTDGSDVILHFDPEILSAQGTNLFEPGVIYDEYPVVSIDPISGIARISGITSANNPGFNGIGELATLNLKAKKEGKTTLSVEFTPNDTTDSNIIETGSTKDILGEVFNLDLMIGGETSSAQTATSCERFSQICLDKNGMQGTQVCKKGSLKNNQCLFDPILSESCSECVVK